jgi:VCBS repeat-containing protein
MFRLGDGNGGSGSGNFTIDYTPPNSAPIAVNDAYTTAEDTALSVPVSGVLSNDDDIDGNVLSSILDDGPTDGTLSLGSGGSFTYTPDANFHGTDAFTYHANDGQLDANIATVAITVNPVNDAPVALDDSATTNQGTPVPVAVLDNDFDPEGDTLLIKSASVAAASGTVAIISNTIQYTPAPDFSGQAAVTYVNTDSSLDSNTATITIKVLPNFPTACTDSGGTLASTWLTDTCTWNGEDSAEAVQALFAAVAPSCQASAGSGYGNPAGVFLVFYECSTPASSALIAKCGDMGGRPKFGSSFAACLWWDQDSGPEGSLLTLTPYCDALGGVARNDYYDSEIEEGLIPAFFCQET